MRQRRHPRINVFGDLDLEAPLPQHRGELGGCLGERVPGIGIAPGAAEDERSRVGNCRVTVRSGLAERAGIGAVGGSGGGVSHGVLSEAAEGRLGRGRDNGMVSAF
ncbi:hypothetical protein [Leifsonia poae]|uniref:hypothetical protein n=1 Tax=Leifsonia poae TaxID=110933 RepID=UPI001CC177AC|nr:hypothetical protein [Leifsonia poae]